MNEFLILIVAIVIGISVPIFIFFKRQRDQKIARENALKLIEERNAARKLELSRIEEQKKKMFADAAKRAQAEQQPLEIEIPLVVENDTRAAAFSQMVIMDTVPSHLDIIEHVEVKPMTDHSSFDVVDTAPSPLTETSDISYSSFSNSSASDSKVE